MKISRISSRENDTDGVRAVRRAVHEPRELDGERRDAVAVARGRRVALLDRDDGRLREVLEEPPDGRRELVRLQADGRLCREGEEERDEVVRVRLRAGAARAGS